MRETLEVTCPFDESPLKTLPMQSAQDAERMLQTATGLFKARDQWLAPYQRMAILKKVAELVSAEADDLAHLIASEGGKPLVDAKVEVARAIDGIHLAIKSLPHVMSGAEVPMGLTAATVNRHATTSYEPIGVVLALSAFNHPLNLIVHQVIPAVAVGCPVIVKPASATPLCAVRLCELLTQAGLPDGWCQPIICTNEVSSLLARSHDIHFLTFIGSARVGWMLKSQLAPGVRCALEHGGVAPVIVDDDLDIDRIIPSLCKGGFYHAGQVCVSVQRIYAPASSAEELAQKLAAAAEQLTVGDARLDDTDVGPLIKPSEVTRVQQWVDEAVQAGAKLLCGGKALSKTTFAPTVLLDPPDHVKVSQQEVFGPVVCVYRYQNRLEAIERANALPFAFQAAVYTNKLDVAQDTIQRLDATAVMVNDHTAFRADWMPFAGRRASGYGVGGIEHTMHDMMQIKMAVFNEY